MLTSPSNPPRTFFLATLLSASRSRVTRAPAYGSVGPKLVMPSSSIPHASWPRHAASSARSHGGFNAAPVQRVVLNPTPISSSAPQRSQKRRWTRAGLRPQHAGHQGAVHMTDATAVNASHTRRLHTSKQGSRGWARNVFLASTGIGCAIGVAAGAVADMSVSGGFIAAPPSSAAAAAGAASSELQAFYAATAGARAIVQLGTAVFTALAAAAQDVGRGVALVAASCGLSSARSTVTSGGDGGEPHMWWMMTDTGDEGAVLGWLGSTSERACSVAARLERFGAWCVGRRTAHREEASDAIPMLAMFTAPLFMLLYALLCCF